ncbi:hypothetical protein AP75_06735 [Kaistella haifensis DSM 19056]|uniref:Uncharacterized protein n=1 Tax=Kaistella haifensis DSM 19056 TaxID=1450526 RepID=A0A2D0A6J6_9FLAO|nr:hypothetical protein [Kaistella haifensis]OWK98294.1 hypothetical protein AP75_06735 [Kaistella haifensis DSM 19056]
MARINWEWIPKKRSQILQIEQIHIGTNPLNRLNPREILIDEENSRRFYRLSKFILEPISNISRISERFLLIKNTLADFTD